MTKIIPKLLFIDTNLLVGCILGDIKGQNLTIEVLKDIEKKLSKDELVLLLPEVIKHEVFDKLEERAGMFSGKIKQFFKSLNEKNELPDFMVKSIQEAEKKLLEDIKKKNEEAQNILDGMFKNKNTKVLKISNDIFFKGCRRALIRKAPAIKNSDGKKNAFKKDQDCISVESVIDFLISNKCNKLVVCTCDADYLKGDKIHPEILEDLNKSCSEVILYKNLLEMLKEEFKKKVTKEDVKRLDDGVVRLTFSDEINVSGKSGYTMIPLNKLSAFGEANTLFVSADNHSGILDFSKQPSGIVMTSSPGAIGIQDYCSLCGVFMSAHNRSQYLNYCINCCPKIFKSSN